MSPFQVGDQPSPGMRICCKHIPNTLESRGKVQAANLRNRLVAVSQQQFHYLSAKGRVVDKKAADIGGSIKVDVEKASVSRFDVGELHIS